jgi:hypothetical protein
MAERRQPRTEYRARDFPGLTVGADPTDLQAGAAVEQLNVQCVQEGEIQTRPGLRRLTFEEE